MAKEALERAAKDSKPREVEEALTRAEEGERPEVQRLAAERRIKALIRIEAEIRKEAKLRQDAKLRQNKVKKMEEG